MTSVIIPYRDRAEHLEILAPRLAQVLPDAEILVIEQVNGKPFNRGKLLNSGSLIATGDLLIMHDVDMIPVFNFPPPMVNAVTQIASNHIQTFDYLGGVTMFPVNLFKQVGGYNNDYYHRAEDNEMRFNLRRLNIPVHNRITYFEQLNHVRPAVEFDPVLWRKAQEPRELQDQLSICEYKIIATAHEKLYTKITVEI